MIRDFAKRIASLRAEIETAKSKKTVRSATAEIKRWERDYLHLVGGTFAPDVTLALPVEEHQPGQWAVYFIHAPVIGRVKIGVSRGVASRFRALKDCAPEEYTLLGWIHGGRAVERAIHELLADSRRHGEWFALTEEVRNKLAAHGMFPDDPLFS